jgi:hypothetical protein
MGDEGRQLASLKARLEVICETIAQLRLECSCRPLREAVTHGTCTTSMLGMHRQA